jgi:hypothetical protein
MNKTQLQDRVDELEQELEDLKEASERDQLWTTHLIDKSANTGGLPVPRLELVWKKMREPKDGYTWYCRYDLVKNHLVGEINRIPLGGTRSSGYHDGVNGTVGTPFRDGAHILFDARELRLPAYAICGKNVTKLDPYEHSGVDAAHEALRLVKD